MDRRRMILYATEKVDSDQYFKVPRYATRTTNMFRSAYQLTDFTLDFSIAENLVYCEMMFQQSSAKTIKIIGQPAKKIYASGMFHEEYSLTAFTGTPFDGTKMYKYVDAFTFIPKLTEIRFVPNTLSESINLAQSSLLSNESVQSIIDGLSTVTTTCNLTLHETVKSKLTDEQKSIIESKGWTIS